MIQTIILVMVMAKASTAQIEGLSFYSTIYSKPLE
jgi:hypothetical protein